MPHRLLSALACQNNRAGHPPSLTGRGGRVGRTVSSLRHGLGAGEMESSMKQRSKKLRKTNTAPLSSLPDVVGVSMDTGGYTP
jgi:hypothetical protein